jgi:hypothetical protein
VILMVSYKLRDLLCREFAGPICGLCKHHTLLEVANLSLWLVAIQQLMGYVRELDVITAA